MENRLGRRDRIFLKVVLEQLEQGNGEFFCVWFRNSLQKLDLHSPFGKYEVKYSSFQEGATCVNFNIVLRIHGGCMGRFFLTIFLH